MAELPNERHSNLLNQLCTDLDLMDPYRLGSAGHGSAGLGGAGHGSAGLGSAGPGTARLGTAGLDTAGGGADLFRGGRRSPPPPPPAHAPDYDVT